MKELNEYTKQNKTKKMHCKNTKKKKKKIAVVTIGTFTCDSPSFQ